MVLQFSNIRNQNLTLDGSSVELLMHCNARVPTAAARAATVISPWSCEA